MSFDEGVQATNCDATKCKYSAVKMGYWEDNYIQHFVPGYERKTPEINRGYYARTRGVAMFMEKFFNVNLHTLFRLSRRGHQCQFNIIISYLLFVIFLENWIKLSGHKPGSWI